MRRVQGAGRIVWGWVLGAVLTLWQVHGVAQIQEAPDPPRLSLNLQGIEVRAALLALAEPLGVNLALSDAVSGTLSLRLKEVRPHEALEVVLRTKGLAAHRIGSVLMVGTAAEWSAREEAEREQAQRLADLEPLRTELFQLHYSRADEVARGLQGGAIGPAGLGSAAGAGPGPGPMGMTDSAPVRRGTGRGSSAAGSGVAHSGLRGVMEGPGAEGGRGWWDGPGGGPWAGEPWEARPHDAGAGEIPSGAAGGRWAAGARGRLLSARGSAIPVLRTNQLFVTDVASRLTQIRSLISRIDIPVRQVLIEARIVQAQEAFGRSLGARLGVVSPSEARGGATGGVAAAGEGAVAKARLDGLRLGMATPLLQGAEVPAQAVALLGAAAGRLLTLELAALEAQGQGRVVSSPRLVTADQVEAHVKQGFRVPYRGTASSLHGAGVQFQEANLKLTVTPHLTPDGKVILNVLVTKDSLGGITPDGREINTREVRTQVLVEDGGTVVLGGIFEEEEADTKGRVPVLSDIPGIGALFRSSGRDTRRTELLVFITPHVLKEAAQPPP